MLEAFRSESNRLGLAQVQVRGSLDRVEESIPPVFWPGYLFELLETSKNLLSTRRHLSSYGIADRFRSRDGYKFVTGGKARSFPLLDFT